MELTYRLKIQLQPKLNDPRVTRSVVFTEERAERSVLVGSLAAKVVRNDRLVVAGEDRGAYRNVQFEPIADRVKALQQRRQPVISIDGI
jgi:hypothetical protein